MRATSPMRVRATATGSMLLRRTAAQDGMIEDGTARRQHAARTRFPPCPDAHTLRRPYLMIHAGSSHILVAHALPVCGPPIFGSVPGVPGMRAASTLVSTFRPIFNRPLEFGHFDIRSECTGRISSCARFPIGLRPIFSPHLHVGKKFSPPHTVS